MGKSAGRGERKQECADKALKIKGRPQRARIRVASKAPVHRQYGRLPSRADEEITPTGGFEGCSFHSASEGGDAEDVFEVRGVVKEGFEDWTRGYDKRPIHPHAGSHAEKRSAAVWRAPSGDDTKNSAAPRFT